MSEGRGPSSPRWSEPEQEHVTQAHASPTLSRWGHPAPEPSEQGEHPPPSEAVPAPAPQAGRPPAPQAEHLPAPSAPPAGSRWGTPAPPPAREVEQQPTQLLQATPPAEQRPGAAQATNLSQMTEPQPQAGTHTAPGAPLPQTPPLAAAPRLPFPQPTEKKDALLAQRSSAWLERLNDPAQTPPPISRSRPLAARSRPLGARPLRSRSRRLKHLSLIAAPLTLVVLLAALLFGLPGLRQRALGLFSAPAPKAVPPQGSLLAQSNVAGSVLSLNNHTYQLSTQGNSGWSVLIAHLKSGTYSLTISAPNYTPASGQVAIQPNQQTVVTAFLTLDKSISMGLLNPASNLIPGQPLAAPIPAGTQYLADRTAAQALKVSIGYRVISLVDTPEPSVLTVGDAGPPAPKTLLSGVVVPDVRFSDPTTGAVLDETHPDALPPEHYLLALTITFDSSGKASFALATPSVLKATSAAGTSLTVPGHISADPALLFTLVSLAVNPAITTDFTCFGLLDTVNAPGNQPNPEDGFLFGANGGAAHYFFRWGQVWTTNAAARALTPALPQANQETLIQAQSILDAGALGQPTGCT